MEINYKQQAKEARLKVLDMVYKAQSSHIGSNFSVIDILTVLFNKVDFSKDKIILSAGWKAASFYYFLAKAGFFPEELLDTYNQDGSSLIGLTEPIGRMVQCDCCEEKDMDRKTEIIKVSEIPRG